MMPCAYQRTLRSSAACAGVGLHSGLPVALRVLPADCDTGILFKRMDIESGKAPRAVVHARYDRVSDTRLGTTIENPFGTKISTVEHVMAALWGAGVDNAVVEVNAPEVPIMDGSAAPFMQLIEQAGLETQDEPRRVIAIDRAVTVRQGDALAMLLPGEGFVLDVEIEFPHAAIARQRACYDFSFQSFGKLLSPARTFGFAREVEALRAMGLARGGSLENAVVLGEDRVLNKEGLRFEDEFVRHKALDCLGDLFLAAMRIEGRMVTRKPGHALNNALLRALFAQPDAWHVTEAAQVETGFPVADKTGAAIAPHAM